MYVLEVNSLPVVLYLKGNSQGNDLVVEHTFPSAQPALFDMMLATKLIQLGWKKMEHEGISRTFDSLAPIYNGVWEKSGLRFIEEELARNFDFSGSVLNLGCGTGAFGHVLDELGAQAEIYGIDICEAMLDQPWTSKYYQQPLCVGPLEELVGPSPSKSRICLPSTSVRTQPPTATSPALTTSRHFRNLAPPKAGRSCTAITRRCSPR